jgi:hypothetical protein
MYEGYERLKNEDTFGKKEKQAVENEASKAELGNVIERKGNKQVEQNVNHLTKKSEYSEQQTIV